MRVGCGWLVSKCRRLGRGWGRDRRHPNNALMQQQHGLEHQPRPMPRGSPRLIGFQSKSDVTAHFLPNNCPSLPLFREQCIPGIGGVARPHKGLAAPCIRPSAGGPHPRTSLIYRVYRSLSFVARTRA
ncbi:hypothetical protein IG631_04133 [Alternaria alternata]|nr:hypothetical protein IG631_04133 [Alternaria alternata]